MTLENLNEVMNVALENAREGITISNATHPDNPIIFCNQGFLTLTGYSREEVLHQDFSFFCSPLPAQPGLKQLRQALQQGQPAVAEIQSGRKNGAAFWSRVSITPVRDAAGVLRHFVWVHDDITTQKENEALRHALHQQQGAARLADAALEQERRLIGEELHDNINQLLATAKLYLSMSGSTLSAQTAIFNAKIYLDNAISEIRMLSARLVHQPVQSPHFGRQLQDLLDSLRPVVPFQIYLHNDISNESSLDENIRVLLYRIVQEQLHNIIKHAQASTVTVALKESASGIVLQVSDNGIGFDADQPQRGIGFSNMRSRLKPVNGRLVLHTSPGAGCRLVVRIPQVQEHFV